VRRPDVFARCLPVAIVVAAIAVPLHPAAAADRQMQLLVLYSTRRDSQIAVVGDRELPSILEDGLPNGIDYYSEFIDQARFEHADYQQGFRDFLELKYREKSFDLVIAMGRVPLEFLALNRKTLFPDSPIVFFSEGASPQRPENATGISAALNLRGTLDLAQALHPDLRHVFVVNGVEEATRPYETLARAQLRDLESRLAITYLTGRRTRDLEARLASLPENSIVYYLVVDRDGNNEIFHPLEYLDRVSRVSNAPVYCWVDSAMDHGVVGGSLKSQLAQTQAIGALALRVLRGERADDIPVTAPDLTVNQVDWRQLRRWGISEARVPLGTIVRFREPSVWDRYKLYIIGALAVLVAQTLLIGGLLAQHARRRQAEKQLLEKQAQLRASYDRIRDLGTRLLNAQETERARIARELHDDIGQQMAVLTIDLQLLSRRGEIPATTAQLATKALDHAEGVTRMVRDLSHRLHPANLRLIGLLPSLSSLQRELSTNEVAITLSHDQVPVTLPLPLTLCVYRVAQEALHNAIAHGRARHASIRVRGAADRLLLTIADDGVGFDVGAANHGLGLISMAERVEQVGGTLEINSHPGRGTRIEVAVPIEGAKPQASVAI
jgi:signal transduction histidine kinase